MKTKYIKLISLLVLLVSLGVLFAACSKTKVKASCIYIKHYSYKTCLPEYKIDLINKKFYSCDGVRNPKGKDEGYKYVKPLKDKDCEDFQKDAEKCGVDKWKPSYGTKTVTVTYTYTITYTFTDGSSKSVCGYDKYPDQWNNLGKACYKLTGYNCIQYK